MDSTLTDTFSLVGRTTRLSIPVRAFIAAGMRSVDLPIEEWIEIPRPSWARNSDQFYAGRVIGESLARDEIHDGDYVIFRTTFARDELRQGDLAAVLTPCGFYLKHVYFTMDGCVRLVSANPDYADMVFDADEVVIQGIAEEMLRKLR